MLFFRKYFRVSWKTFPSLFSLSFYALKFFLKSCSQKQIKEKLINVTLSASRFKDANIIGKDFAHIIMGLILPDAKEEILHLRSKGYETVLLSASPDFYLKHISSALGFSSLICTETEIKNSSVSIKGINCYGKNKIKMLLEKYENIDIDFKNSYCFSDHESDLGLLELFGNAFIVNNKKIASRIKIKDNKSHIQFLEWN